MKKAISILLVMIMLFTMVPVSAFAEGATTVKLVSFMRGDVNDLRSSELLEVQVEGYDGNPRELTYKWTSSLGTYLYIYNSHNMYGINNTYGEMEIYNTDKKISRSSNVEADRSGNQTLTKEGFMWASVYGAYEYSNTSAKNALAGTVKVEVYDKKGTKLGEDSFSSFKAHNLDNDLDNVVIGLFEGEEMNALDLLGRSGIVHITCEQSKVTAAKIKSGTDKVNIVKNSGNYIVKGVSAGEAKVEISISKDVCKFHYKTSGNAEPVIYIFKKPTTSTTTTTLTLDKNSIDNRCEYFINGNKGEEQDDGTILFTGLDPNTTYTVEVRAEYDDNGKTKYVYGYVEDTTKPVYKATVKTYLDGVITDISAIHGEDVELFLVEKTTKEHIEVAKTATGTYTATVVNGVYYPWHHEAGNHDHMAREYELIVEHANAELHLHHYSVNYNTNGGKFNDGEKVGTEIYSSMSAVNATSNIPVRDGYVFAGWEYDKKLIGAGEEITSSIAAPITLVAKWEKEVNVTINVTIDHEFNINGEAGVDPNPDRSELVVDFLEMKEGTPAFVETGDKLNFKPNNVTDENGNAKAYDYAFVDEHISTYTAHSYTYSGLLETSAFGVAVSKSGYDVESVTKTQDVDGNWTIDIKLICKPDDFDVDFSVEMEKDTPKELYPSAVIVKIAYWNKDLKEWKIISQQETTDSVTKPGVRVDIDPETGKGFGSYPVWMYDNQGNAYGYRAVVTGFIYDSSTIIVPTEKDHTKDDNTVIVTYTDGNYTATMGDIADGKKFSTSLNGAYYNKETSKQQGTLHGVISVEKYNVTFDAQGGTVNSKDNDIAEGQYYVPEFKNYQPVMDGHKFLGWYKDSACTIPATEGELLVEDITLYASWDQILTGNVKVAGYYLQNGGNVKVWEVDRATSAVVALQEITSDGVYNIDRKTVNINWPKADEVYGVSEEYRFEGLDPLKKYRVEILVLNYGTDYQNSTTAADSYNENDYKAIYPESSKWETFVNAYLSFEPASYFQPVEVDATLVGKNLRPEDTLVQVWYKATGTDNPYQVISQHTVVPYGIEVGMGADGKDDADYGYYVWNSLYNGALYDYQAYLDKIEGEKVSSWPVSVVYGEPSRYSPLNNAATGVLQVKLVPNRYSIIYHECYANENTEVVNYGTHTWSYETVINYVPERDGYNFEGWYSNPECTGEKVTAIAETVAENTNLYAKWEKKTDLELTVNYVVKGSNANLATETKENLTFGANVTAESLKKDFDGFKFDSTSAESVTIGTGKNEITLYYVKTATPFEPTEYVAYMVEHYKIGDDGEYHLVEEDTGIFTGKVGQQVVASAKTYPGYCLNSYYSPNTMYGVLKPIKSDSDILILKLYYDIDNVGGNNGSESDGHPDKYQKKVTFNVVNGTWSDGTTSKVIYILMISETAMLDIPKDMRPDQGFKDGYWETPVPEIVRGTNDEEYTYIFEEAPYVPPVEPENPADPETPDTPDTPSNPDGDGTGDGDTGSGSIDTSHYIVFGKTNSIGWYNVSLDGGETYQIVFGNSTLEVAEGTEMLIKAGDLVGGDFTFYVNGNAVKPDENNEIKLVVDGYMLIGALAIEPDVDFEVPDAEESLNWFQKIIKAIKDFFAKLFGKK